MPIVAEKLNFTYMSGSSASHNALKDVSFTIEEGTFTGIIGHTGSGKSTLVQHLNGLMQPQSGRISVDGYDMLDKSQRIKGRRLVGVVFQYPEHQLFEETVLRDVGYGPRNMGMSDEEADARARDAMRLVGLLPEKFMDKSPFELSGGEKRRAALAGIIAMQPKYLVLDEPMAGLDPLGRSEILDTIDSLRESLGIAVVMVSHSMDDVAKRASRVMVINGGAIDADGTPEEVFSDPVHLTQMGLDIPQASKLALALNARGIDVPLTIHDMDAMQEYLLGRLKCLKI